MTAKTTTPVCKHPPARQFCWFAKDETLTPVLCVGCCDCGEVLAGGATLEEKAG